MIQRCMTAILIICTSTWVQGGERCYLLALPALIKPLWEPCLSPGREQSLEAIQCRYETRRQSAHYQRIENKRRDCLVAMLAQMKNHRHKDHLLSVFEQAKDAFLENYCKIFPDKGPGGK